MRLVGPNCVGVVNTDPDIRMNATFSPVGPVPGRVGCRVPIRWRRYRVALRAHALGLGVSTFVSMGNKADVSSNDLLQYWADDPETDVVLLYLESFGNPRKFAHLARQLARTKPIVALKSGRTAAGARGTRSHTAALADPDAAVDALLRQIGRHPGRHARGALRRRVARSRTNRSGRSTGRGDEQRRWPGDRRRRRLRRRGARGARAVAADCRPRCASSHRPAACRTRSTSSRRPARPSSSVPRGSCSQSGEIDALLVIYVAPYVTSADDVARRGGIEPPATPATSRSRRASSAWKSLRRCHAWTGTARSCPRSPIRSPRRARWPTPRGSASGASSPRERFATARSRPSTRP